MTAPISNEPTTTRLHHYAGHYLAGMSPSTKSSVPYWVHFPRVSGDEPEPGSNETMALPFSPRERG